MTIVASNSLTISNVNDGTITHTAYSYSADGTDRFTTVYPNLNLLDGTKDFSGSWDRESWGWENDGIYKGLTVKKRRNQWGGINKTFTAPKDGIYTFSAYVKSSGNNANIHRFTEKNGTTYWDSGAHKELGNNFGWLRDSFTVTLKAGDTISARYEISGSTSDSILWTAGHKWEDDSSATPYMPSSSEVTTADWPSYIGQYTDFTQADSTNPSAYTWSLIRGNDGKDGEDGHDGTNGKDGDPGKIVSDTEPSTRFKGLTWKYSGTSDLTASDGTVINPNTEYYYNGTHWMINYLSANNIEANSIKADKIDAKNLTITDGEFVSTTTNGPVTTSTEIKDNHIAISKTDGTVNTKNDLAVDTEQGFAMKFTNNTTGLTREASVNFQGVSTSDSNGNYAQLTPQGTKLSTDVPWTNITRSSGVGTSGTLRARINNGVFYAQSKDVTIPSIAPNSLITIGTMSSKFSGVSGFDTLGLLYSLGQLSVASVTVGNDGKINIGNPNPTTMSGKVIQFSINIPLG